MSSTELYGLTETFVKSLGEVKNSWRGSFRIWRMLENKYLPSLPKPHWAIEDEPYYSRVSDPNLMHSVWDLFKDPRLTRGEKIVLQSTFDKVLVRVSNVPQLIDAFRSFEEGTSLPEQADLIEKAVANDPSIVAIGWNHTSINGDTWKSANFCEETEESLGYNLSKDTDHWFLPFD